MNPRYWLHGSDCINFDPHSQVKAVQYEDICQFMHNCFWSNNDRIFDDVCELRGGTATVSVLMIRRRQYKVGPN
eukprot:12905043-Prorocentrum_lima.AAC.1